MSVSFVENFNNTDIEVTVRQVLCEVTEKKGEIKTFR